MQRVERQAVLAASPAEVFAYLADLDNLAEWQSGVVSAERGEAGDVRVGSTALVVRELMGQRMEAPLTVVEHEPPRRLGIGTEVSGVKALATLNLSPTEDGSSTNLAFAMEIRGSMLTGFMEPMIASAAGGEIDSSLERLQARFGQRP